MVEIPIDPTDPLFTQSSRLDGVEYSFAFDWNDREGRWYMTVVGFATRRKVLGDWVPRPILGGPAGAFFFFNDAPHFDPPGRFDLGTITKLVYFTAVELSDG